MIKRANIQALLEVNYTLRMHNEFLDQLKMPLLGFRISTESRMRMYLNICNVMKKPLLSEVAECLLKKYLKEVDNVDEVISNNLLISIILFFF